MKNVLLTRHSGTEVLESSLYKVFSQIEQIVEENHNAIKSIDDSGSKYHLDKWILENASRADLIITSDPYALKILKENAWGGKTIFKALGGFPRGAASLRGALPYLNSSDVIWCNSTADMEIYSLLVAHDGTQPKAVYIPYSMDDQNYYPLENKEIRQKQRKAWGANPEDFVLVYAGRVTIEKNVHATLEVVAELARQGYPVKLVIIGKIEDVPFREFQMHSANLENKITELIEASGISERVTIQEWQTREALNEVLNAADAFINLTLHHDENFGLSQIEAMSSGLPVIGTAWGGLKDTVVDEKVGFAIDTWVTTKGIRYDAPRVIESIKELFENQQLRESQRRHARAHAIRNYSDTLYSQRVTQLIEDVINETHEKTKPTFTLFGSQFDQRFARAGYPIKYSKSARAPDPVYDGLSDPDYMTLIRPYTSRNEQVLEPESRLFRAMTGHLNGKYFISDDLLYSIRIPVSSEEADVINELNRWESVRLSMLDYPDELLISLVEKGLLGISKEVR